SESPMPAREAPEKTVNSAAVALSFRPLPCLQVITRVTFTGSVEIKAATARTLLCPRNLTLEIWRLHRRAQLVLRLGRSGRIPASIVDNLGQTRWKYPRGLATASGGK